MAKRIINRFTDTKGYTVEKVILKGNPNMLPCKKCGDTRDETMECPKCRREFCGDCFQEILEGDGRTIKCPYTDCGEELLLS